MAPYFILLFLVAFFAFGSESLKGSAGVRYLTLLIVATILILFQGLRDRLVGTDTAIYVRRFELVTSTQDIWRSTEIGYNAMNVFLSQMFESYIALLLAIAVIVVGCYVLGIVKMTKHYALALLLFVVIGAYTFSFNAARQGIAVAFCFLALPFLLQRRFVPYFSLIGIAALFHHTAVIAAPLYLLSATQIRWRHWVGIVLGTALFTVSLGSVVELSAIVLNEAYSAYSEGHSGGGEVMVMFLVSQGICLYWLRPRNVHAEGTAIYSRLLSIYLVGLVPALASVIASVNPSGILRLHTYFAHTAIVLWPMALYQVKGNTSRSLASIGLVILMTVFFYMTTTTFSKLVPYRLNAESSL